MILPGSLVEVSPKIPYGMSHKIPSEIPPEVSSRIPPGVPSIAPSGDFFWDWNDSNLSSGIAPGIPFGIPRGTPSKIPFGIPPGHPQEFHARFSLEFLVWFLQEFFRKFIWERNPEILQEFLWGSFGNSCQDFFFSENTSGSPTKISVWILPGALSRITDTITISGFSSWTTWILTRNLQGLPPAFLRELHAEFYQELLPGFL